MKISTRFFGEIEIDENKIISFPEGIPGFEELTKFLLLDIEDNEHLKCLQSLEDGQICLLVTSPWNYFKEYEFNISDDDIKKLGISSPDDVDVYNIITVREDKITANLISPVIINLIKNLGKQIILSDSNYSIRQEISCL